MKFPRFRKEDDMSEKNVIFGSGPLGLSVLFALIKRGKQVVIVNRSGKITFKSMENVEVIAGDAYDQNFTKKVTENASIIYHCAQPPYQQWVEKFPALQHSILDAAISNGSKLIVAENLYMYGDTNGLPMTEDMPYKATTRKGKLRAQLSNDLFSAYRAGKVQVSVARGADFFGPNVISSSLGGRTIPPLLKGKPAEITGSLDQPHTYTYIRDFGEALAILGENHKAFGQFWHVPNSRTLTQRELVTLFFKEAGLEPRFSVMGKFMLTLGGLFVPEARETIEMLYEFEKPFIVDSSKFISTFGDISTPQEIAIKETLEWFKDSKLV
jgi:nucleoside-diphosphate-sugar epimerase